MTTTLTTSETSTKPMPKLWAKLPIRTGNIIQLSGIAAGAALIVAAAHLHARRRRTGRTARRRMARHLLVQPRHRPRRGRPRGRYPLPRLRRTRYRPSRELPARRPPGHERAADVVRAHRQGLDAPSQALGQSRHVLRRRNIHHDRVDRIRGVRRARGHPRRSRAADRQRLVGTRRHHHRRGRRQRRLHQSHARPRMAQAHRGQDRHGLPRAHHRTEPARPSRQRTPQRHHRLDASSTSHSSSCGQSTVPAFRGSPS